MISSDHDTIASSHSLRNTTDERHPMPSCSFLSAYPVLALGFRAPEHDALIRNLPSSIRIKFVFNSIMDHLNLDWKSLDHVVDVIMTESSIRVVRRNSRHDGGYFSIFFSEQDGSLKCFVHEIFLDSSTSTLFCGVEKWSEMLEAMHNSISIVEEVDQVFRAYGWYIRIVPVWTSPNGDCTCQIFWETDGGCAWDFWGKRGENRTRVVAFMLHNGKIIPRSYAIGLDEYYSEWKFRIPINEYRDLPRQAWLNKISEQIRSVSEEPKLEASPKRQKIEV